ncbi:MAG: hypothetical protein HY705_09160 [Gemmatimonadetes bacterium]|nr:hypothetical protein [Gemmatimonadota bacterium]
MPSSTGPRTRGFVLPTTLLVTTLLTVMLTAAFILVSAEYRTTDNSLAASRALSLAQAGLQSYFAQDRNLTGSTTYDSVRYAYSTGYADVVAQRLHPAAGLALALWVARSSGYDTVRVQPGQTNGKRVVAQLAQLNPGTIPARASLVAPNGVQMSASGSNPISGKDYGGCSPKADTAGLTVPVGGYGGSSGSQPAGNPGLEQIGTATTVIDSTRIDWASLLAGNFTPDYLSSGATFSTALTGFPTGLHTGDVTITTTSGRGLLVVTGDVTLASGMRWDGIIIAGGRITATSSSFRVYGMIISGLNLSLGQNVLFNQVRRGGGRDIRWASCNAGPTVTALSALVPVRNGWVDTWTTY